MSKIFLNALRKHNKYLSMTAKTIASTNPEISYKELRQTLPSLLYIDFTKPGAEELVNENSQKWIALHTHWRAYDYLLLICQLSYDRSQSRYKRRYFAELSQSLDCSKLPLTPGNGFFIREPLLILIISHFAKHLGKELVHYLILKYLYNYKLKEINNGNSLGIRLKYKLKQLSIDPRFKQLLLTLSNSPHQLHETQELYFKLLTQ
jgi:hypothetical protein